MAIKKYEKKFTEMYKEADKLQGMETEKLSEEAWKKRCNKLFKSSEEAEENIDEDVEKLSDFKGMFRRINPRTSCDMIASYIEDDCKTWPDRCPIGVKKIIVEKLKKDIEREEGTARILKTKPNEERIKKIEEQIKKLEK